MARGVEAAVQHVVVARAATCAGFAGAGGPGPVDEDPEEPRLHRRPALETVDASHDAEPRVLDDLLGHCTAGYERLGEAQQPGVMSTHQGREGCFVAGAERVEQRRVGIGHQRRG